MKNKKVENAITAILVAAVLITGGMSLYSYLSEQKAKSEYDAIRQEAVVEEPKLEETSIQRPISARIAEDSFGNLPFASGPTFRIIFPPLETHSTSFLISMEAGL